MLSHWTDFSHYAWATIVTITIIVIVITGTIVAAYCSRAGNCSCAVVLLHGVWCGTRVPHIRHLPLFGNTFALSTGREHQVDAYSRIYRRFAGEKYCGFYQTCTPYLMVRDPELIHGIMVRDFAHFTDHGVRTDPATDVMANSLFFLTGRRWKAMRRMLDPGFTPGKLRCALERVDECAERLMHRIDDGLQRCARLEVKQIVGRYSTDAIGTCAFGLRSDAIADDDSEFRVHAKKMFRGRSGIKRLYTRSVLAVCPPLARVLGLQLYPPDTSAFFYAAFDDVIRDRHERDVVRNDLTQTLIQARKELVHNVDLTDENKFNESDIIGNAILMFTSGSGTVSSTLAFCLYELALNKHVQDKLRKEIRKTKKKHGGQFNYDFFTDIHYANMVLDETARMYSVVCTLIREATKTYIAPDDSLVIQKGQKIIIPMYNIHHDPKYYPNPDIFDPERFCTKNKSKRLNGTFIPFGDGPRMCIGKRFAELEMILVLSKILTKFEVLPCEKTEIPLDIRSESGFISPKNGVWLNFKPIVIE